MNRLLYYVPGLNAVNDDALAKAGLDHLVGCSLAYRGVSQGPDGGKGAVFSCSPRPRRRTLIPWRGCPTNDDMIGYYPKVQDWTKCGERPLWVGWRRNELPGPDAFARVEQVGGYEVELADGNLWTIPPASAIPRRIRYGADGVIIREAGTRHAAYTAAAERILEWAKSEDEVPYTDYVETLSQALAVNYCISVVEVLALGLIDDECAQDVASAMWDGPKFAAMLDIEKKADGAA